MPLKPLKPCKHITCKELTRDGLCEKHRLERVQEYNNRRPEYHKWYSQTRWRKARLVYLRQNPICVYCQQDNKLTPATVVDHIKPHKGNKRLFWDSHNWQALCKVCHDTKTATEDGAFGNK